MTRIFTILALAAITIFQTGCGSACGPILTVPQQRVALVGASPSIYTIRVTPRTGSPIDTPVPTDGRVAFDVPVTSRDSYFIVLGMRVYHYPHPETFRVIHVLRDERTIRKLSARDIAQLPPDSDGYHILRIEK